MKPEMKKLIIANLRELFKIMRQYPSLVNAYQDIIKVVDNKEGQS